MTQLALMEFDGAKKWRRQRRRPSAEGDMGCARGEERRKNEEENMGKNIQKGKQSMVSNLMANNDVQRK